MVKRNIGFMQFLQQDSQISRTTNDMGGGLIIIILRKSLAQQFCSEYWQINIDIKFVHSRL